MALFKTYRVETVIHWATIALLGAFTVGQFLLAWDRSPSGDDALFLSVPKNWLNGYGWATSYSEKIPFNPDFTGPAALLLPAALLIKLFGTQWWIAGITGALINLILMCLCLWQIRAYGKNSAMVMLCLCCGIVASFTQDFASLIGYYTGSLLFLLAVCIAFNNHYSIAHRALWVGIFSSIGLLIKPLLLPAFILLILIFLVANTINKTLYPRTVLLLLLPPILVATFRYELQQQALAAYSDNYRQIYDTYARDFLHHHGSGIGQWLAAKDKLHYIISNANKNLYFVEEGLASFGIRNPFLGNEPADVHHIVGALYIISLFTIVIALLHRIAKKPSPTAWLMLTLSSAILLYTLWFVLFAMAMSPGHLYFSMQWSLWLLLLLVAQLWKPERAVINVFLVFSVIIFSLGYCLSTENRKLVFSLDRSTIAKTEGLNQALEYIEKTHFPSQLAGCGYNGYPRHLEYKLPTSQNFADCLDLIEDHVVKTSQHYQWKSPLNFTLVLSQQSMSFDKTIGQVIRVCQNNILYRNSDVYIVQCRFEDLKTIDLDILMPGIQASHQWYKTRLTSKAMPQ